MKALIVGAGAQGRVILDILRAQGRHDSFAFIDDNPETRERQVNGVSIACGLEEALQSFPGAEMIVALGNPLLRLDLARRIREGGGTLLNAVHPSAVVAASAILGHGMMVGATAVINSNAQIADNVIINTGAVVEHDCWVAEGAAVSPGAHLGGRVVLGRCSFVGTGAILNSRVAIGERTIVGAGAVVTRSLPDRVLALGVPARIVEKLDETFDWNRVL